MIKRIQSILAVFIMLLTVPAISMAEVSNSEFLESSVFEIYFLDVGQGDSAVINCDGHILMIDGGNADKSDYIYSFLKSHSFEKLDYIIATHPDADHVGGLAGALNYAGAGIVFCTDMENDTKTFQDFQKYLAMQKGMITVPNAGDVFTLGTARVSILAPEKGEKLTGNTSVVVRIVYGDTAFLFMGDAEWEDEHALVKSKTELKSDVIKIGHHGSDDSTSEEFLKKVKPSYAVISVGEENVYGHPADEVLYRLEKTKTEVYRTDVHGLIRCTSDGKKVLFETEKDPLPDEGITRLEEEEDLSANAARSADADENGMEEGPADNDECDYIANKNTHKFHFPDCSSVDSMKEKNKYYFFGDREELIAEGYKPCGRCNP